MDQSLDEVIANRQRGSRGQRGRRGNNGHPRDGVRKSSQRDTRDLDQDWVHDRYDDDSEPARPRRGGYRPDRPERSERVNPPTSGRNDAGFKLKVENIHYEITEDDLKELFSRVGRVISTSLVYDRQDRSTGVAYVTYQHLEDAMKALNEFNGQNAYDQPIYLTMLPSKDGSTVPSRREPDSTSRQSRSLFDRIENPAPGRRRGRDRRSLSPDDQIRHSDVSKPAPDHIDRYVPGQRDNSRRWSPVRRGGPRGAGGAGRRPGARREQTRRDEQPRQTTQGRPRKTQEELDAEMDDYWNQGDSQPQPQASNGNNASANGNGSAPVAAAPAAGNDDIDMIE